MSSDFKQFISSLSRDSAALSLKTPPAAVWIFQFLWKMIWLTGLLILREETGSDGLPLPSVYTCILCVIVRHTGSCVRLRAAETGSQTVQHLP